MQSHHFKHYFELDHLDDKLKIDFVDKHLNQTNEIALSALDTLLSEHFEFKENTDYEIVKKEYDSKKQSYVVINGITNIIIILNYLLSEKAKHKFCMRPTAKLDHEQEKWRSYLIKILISCIGNKKLSSTHTEKVYPIILDYLNAQYELLKNEELVKKLKAVPYEFKGSDLLQHPFYQVLFLLKSDYTLRKQEYDNKGFFDRVGKSVDKEAYEKIFDKYIDFVPDCYCDQIKNEMIINEEKIKRSRESSEPPKNPTRSKHSPESSNIVSAEKNSGAIRGTHSAPTVSSSISNISIGLHEASNMIGQENTNPGALLGTKSSPGLLNGFSKKLPTPRKEDKKTSLIKSL